MSNEKNYTREEIDTIVNEALRKSGLATHRELNMDEMANVSGGYDTRRFKTHEEIDQVMDVICSVWDTYGRDVAAATAFELGVTSSSGMGGNEKCVLDRYTHPQGLRKWLHQELNGEHDPMILRYRNT